MSYVLTQFIPYEGQDVTEHDTLEEVRVYLANAKAGWDFNSDKFTLYEVIREMDIRPLLEGGV